ncbi:FecR family protein [Abyssalbus ytuae]|uniref:FecR family protein n=1 Tax=Abyssalbus ytuae TaxID=2926907 RepID=A0A9E6ZWV8_9FLAO|nr:FecR family protein [Abyssalbus ytuae]UOB16672.1 FecR family protein [Abyssalbus ytuae]
MEENYDKLLVRWLNRELTLEEERSFKHSESYKSNKSIIEGISKLKVPDEQTWDEAYSEFRQKLQNSDSQKRGTVINLKTIQYLSYAACVILILGLAIFFMGKTTINTAIGQQQIVTLPDNSVVTMNASSKLAYNKYLFNFTRKLDLNGEAFFEVQKGSDFKVTTHNGQINVLGTKFNVLSREDFFETACFEGKVKVSAGNDNAILTSGKKVSFTEGNKKENIFDINSEKPGWMSGISSFKSTPLKHVINQLESIFPVTFNDKNIIDKLSMSYTGMFPHKDLNKALENVFLPMGIEYSKDENDSSIIILKEQTHN